MINDISILKSRLEHEYKVLRVLTSDFIELHFLNLDTDEYTPYYIENDEDVTIMPVMSMYADFYTCYREFVNTNCHPDDREEMMKSADKEFIRQQLENKKRYTFRFRLKVGPDNYRWCTYCFVKFEDVHQTAVEIAFGFYDVDDDVRHEIERRDAFERIRQAEKDKEIKSRFVQNISHEVRTPLNAILGFTQILTDDSSMLSDAEKEEFKRHINNNTELLLMMIDDLLNMSDIEHGTLEAKKAQMFCNRVGQKSVDCSMPRVIGPVNLHFTTDVPDDCYIISDAHRIQQILVHLIANACSATTSGEIRVHCSGTENEGFITYSVADTGRGIPAEKVEKIARRLDVNCTNHIHKGLGLDICRNLTAIIGGQIKLDTSYTDGARFVLILPKE